MRLDIAERMICPAPHARTPLIVVARRRAERELLDGALGCMTCHREGQVVDGDVLLTSRVAAASEIADASPAALDRLEAQLGLSEPGARVLLAPAYASYAAGLAQRVEATVVVLNAGAPTRAGVSSVWLDEAMVPFSNDTFSCAALDASLPAAQVLDALRTVQRGGRVVGRAPLEVPAGVAALARDDREWVGAREASPENVVRITRR